jgi:hypothetical protein
MAAWVASLPVEQRRAIGDAKRPDDSIWVPLIGAVAVGGSGRHARR